MVCRLRPRCSGCAPARMTKPKGPRPFSQNVRRSLTGAEFSNTRRQAERPRRLRRQQMTTDNIFSGLKVVDLASFIAGPAAAVILSDFGADVIKVEPPKGELWRIA